MVKKWSQVSASTKEIAMRLAIAPILFAVLPSIFFSSTIWLPGYQAGVPSDAGLEHATEPRPTKGAVPAGLAQPTGPAFGMRMRRAATRPIRSRAATRPATQDSSG